MSNPQPTTFEAAPLDSYAERITSGVALLGGVLILPALFWYLSGIGGRASVLPGIVVSSAFSLVMATWLLLNYAAQPVQYRIEASKLVIRRRWWRAVEVPFGAIAGVSLAQVMADVPARGLRRAFNAGVFGYNGPYQLAPYGWVFFAATSRERLAAIARTNAMPLLVSPARPRPFVEALREALLRNATLGQPPAASGSPAVPERAHADE